MLKFLAPLNCRANACSYFPQLLMLLDQSLCQGKFCSQSFDQCNYNYNTSVLTKKKKMLLFQKRTRLLVVYKKGFHRWHCNLDLP
jgi:hypothetical protein